MLGWGYQAKGTGARLCFETEIVNYVATRNLRYPELRHDWVMDAEILILRYGLSGFPPLTLKATGRALNRAATTIDQRIKRCFRRLNHPGRAKFINPLKEKYLEKSIEREKFEETQEANKKMRDHLLSLIFAKNLRVFLRLQDTLSIITNHPLIFSDVDNKNDNGAYHRAAHYIFLLKTCRDAAFMHIYRLFQAAR